MVSGVPRSLRLRATRPAAVWYRCIRVGCQPTGNGTAQCKKFAEFTVDNFKDAVAEFEKELNRWQRRNVKQFRLFVACPCADTKVLDEVHSATERLLKKGIQFEFLDGHRLVGQLRRYPELVSQYIGVHWVEVLCGGRSASTLIGTRKGDVLSGLGLNDFVLAEWQSDRSRELDEIREKFRCGRVFDAYNHLRAFAQSPAWDSLSGEVRALALRVLASMELDRCGDVDAARRWIAIARKADPFGNFRIIDASLAATGDGRIRGRTGGVRCETIRVELRESPRTGTGSSLAEAPRRSRSIGFGKRRSAAGVVWDSPDAGCSEIRRFSPSSLETIVYFPSILRGKSAMPLFRAPLPINVRIFSTRPPS